MKLFQKTKLQKIALISSIVLSTGGLFGVTTVPVFAATNQLYLTPATNSVQKDSTFSVSLRVNPSVPINAVQASIGYDTAFLSLQSIDCSGSPLSAFPNCPSSGNPVLINSILLGDSINSDSFVAKFTFKALANTNSTPTIIDLSNGGTAYNGTAIDVSTADATVTISTPATVPTPTPNPTPAPTCAAGQTGTYPKCVTPSGSSSGSKSSASGGAKSTTTTTTPPVTTPTTPTTDGTTSVVSKSVAFTQATINTTSTAPTQQYIQFGTNKDSLTKKTAVSDFATTHALAIDPALLSPGQTYYYVVVSKAQDGTITQTNVDGFTTTGLTLRVGVYDKNRKAIAKKTITLHSTPVTAMTDDKGYATFSNVTPGVHQVQYVAGGKTYSEQVEVQNNVKTTGDTQTAPVQTFSVVYNFVSTKSLAGVRYIIIGLLAVLLVVGLILFGRRKIHSATTGGAPRSVEPIVFGTQPEVSRPVTGEIAPTAPDVTEAGQRLNSIPVPAKPAPGSTVTPGIEERNRF